MSADNLRKLPPACYARLDGKSVVIRKGVDEPEPRNLTDTQIHYRNYHLGITSAQVQAMIAGVTFGWDHSSADPDKHQANPTPLQHMTVAIPLVVTVDVEAYSNQDAIEQAKATLNLPEGIEIDGDPRITRKH